MTTIGILSEGPTDQKVVEQVLLGFFDRSDMLEINPFFPPVVPLPGEPKEGGWTVLKRRLQDGHHRQALQFNDYIVIHIDTDVCEETGYGVPRRDLDPAALRAAACVGMPTKRRPIVFARRCWPRAGSTRASAPSSTS